MCDTSTCIGIDYRVYRVESYIDGDKTVSDTCSQFINTQSTNSCTCNLSILFLKTILTRFQHHLHLDSS